MKASLQIISVLGGSRSGREQLRTRLVEQGARSILPLGCAETSRASEAELTAGVELGAICASVLRGIDLGRGRESGRADPGDLEFQRACERARQVFTSLGAGRGPLLLTEPADSCLIEFWSRVASRSSHSELDLRELDLRFIVLIPAPPERAAYLDRQRGDEAIAWLRWAHTVLSRIDPSMSSFVFEASLREQPDAQLDALAKQLGLATSKAMSAPGSAAGSDVVSMSDAAVGSKLAAGSNLVEGADAPRLVCDVGEALARGARGVLAPDEAVRVARRIHAFLDRARIGSEDSAMLEGPAKGETNPGVMHDLDALARAQRALWESSTSADAIRGELTSALRLTRSALQTGSWRLSRMPRQFRHGRSKVQAVEASLLRQLERASEAAASGPDPRDLARRLQSVRSCWNELTTGRAFVGARRLLQAGRRLRGARHADGEFEEIPKVLDRIEDKLRLLDPEESPATACEAGPGRARVDVIVPVYKGLDETLCALASVLRARDPVAHELVVIDDRTPEPALRSALRALAERRLITLIEQSENRGFVAAVNAGMALHPDRDVVLLNSDTEVNGNWLERLQCAAYSTPDVGTVTPLSNNATLCSYPEICRENSLPDDVDLEDLDGLFARCNAGRVVDLPTAVGFCMYIKRRCLEQIGAFDEETWGRGYGEENDFSLKARRRGWRNVAACDVFVRHSGGVAFEGEKDPRVEAALAKLADLYPDYDDMIHRFLRVDPLRAARRNVDLARLGQRHRSCFLFITHALGGGTERHVVALAERLRALGIGCLLLRPLERGVVSLSEFGLAGTPNLLFELPGDYRALRLALSSLPITHVHFHHLVHFPGSVVQLIHDLSLPYDVTLHDYFMACPRITLIDRSGRYCGEPPITACEACAGASSREPVEHSVASVAEWRQTSARILQRARRCFVPSGDAAGRLRRYFPDVDFTVRPHFDQPFHPQRTLVAPTGARRRIAVIGAIGPHKGFEVLLGCARDACERQLDLDFVLIGYSCRDELLRDTGRVEITGRYAEGEVPMLIDKTAPNAALFASVWPETYSYTLSIALAAGLYPFSFDLGAPAERLRQLDWGTLIPLDTEPAELNDLLLRTRLDPGPGRMNSVWRASYADLLRDYYELPREAALDFGVATSKSGA